MAQTRPPHRLPADIVKDPQPVDLYPLILALRVGDGAEVLALLDCLPPEEGQAARALTPEDEAHPFRALSVVTAYCDQRAHEEGILVSERTLWRELWKLCLEPVPKPERKPGQPSGQLSPDRKAFLKPLYLRHRDDLAKLRKPPSDKDVRAAFRRVLDGWELWAIMSGGWRPRRGRTPPEGASVALSRCSCRSAPTWSYSRVARGSTDVSNGHPEGAVRPVEATPPEAGG